MTDIFADFKYIAQDMHNQPQSVVLEAPIRLPQDSILPSRNILHLEASKGYINFDIKKEENVYYIEIVDIVSSNKGNWHGTILMDALFMLIQKMEEKMDIDIPVIFGELSPVDNRSYNIKFYHDYLTVKNAQIYSDYIIVYDVYQRIGSNQYNPNIIEAGYSEEIQSIYLVKSFKYIKQ